MDQGLGRVPDDVRDGLFGVDPQQMLQYRQERNLLRRVDHLAQDGVENVQVRTQVNSIGTYTAHNTKYSYDDSLPFNP